MNKNIDFPVFVLRRFWGTYAPYIKCFIELPNSKEKIEVKNLIWNQFRRYDDIMTAFNDKKITYPKLKIKSNWNDLYLTDEKWKNWWGEFSKEEKEKFIKDNYL